ncbi:uncharacterized protein LOC111693875 isoform X2 [Trichogramma pretiosum]|uniref:uncharacterized protein LOC111693875 isoform X2 n=1 Tax=Trichogramma pretiosum TaxID=7493 RepID=UPI000C71C8C4|nr:uncharacterized protein LOC111693875 isoform X2 [Trichogramma pretiosum]
MAFWWHNRTWLNFLKIQCCVAIVAAMATFIYALHSDVPKDNLSIVAMSLETFLLMSISSPISQALIIYAEISNFHPSQQLQPMVIAVITGVPILAILSTELTRKTIGWKHESWWIIFGTGAYNIFVMCSIALLLTFLLLYIAIIQKTKNLLKNFSKKDVFKLRIKMLHCSALVIFGIVTMEISSIVYINSSSIIYHYIFAFHSALLGFIILMVYVACSDVLIMTPSLKKLKRHMESENDVSTEHHTKAVRFHGVPELDRELSSSSASAVTQLPAGTTYLLAGVCEPVAVYPEARGVAVGIDARDYSGGEVGSTYTPHIGLPEIQIHRVDERYLENVTASGSNCASVRTNTDSYTLGGKQRCDVTAQTESQAFFGSLAMPPAPEPYATVLPEFAAMQHYEQSASTSPAPSTLPTSTPSPSPASSASSISIGGIASIAPASASPSAVEVRLSRSSVDNETPPSAQSNKPTSTNAAANAHRNVFSHARRDSSHQRARSCRAAK